MHDVNTDILKIANLLEDLLCSIGCTIGALEHNGNIEDAYQELDNVLKDIEKIKKIAKSLSKENLQKILAVLHCLSEPICALNFIRADGEEFLPDIDGGTIDVRQGLIDTLNGCLVNHSARLEALAGELKAEWTLTYSTDYSGVEQKDSNDKALSPMATPQASGEDDKDTNNQFILKGHFWDVRFNGVASWIKDYKGMGYIEKVLVKRPKTITAIDLEDLPATPDRFNREDRTMNEPAPQKTQRQVYEEIKDLRSEIKQAQDDNDDGRIKQLEYEIKEYFSLIQVDDNKIRIREATQRVRLAINRAYKNLPEDLAIHFRNSITISESGIAYNPSPPISWQV